MLAILVSIVPFRFFPLGLPSNPYRALVSLSFQFFHSLLELLCSCVRCRGSVGSLASYSRYGEARILCLFGASMLFCVLGDSLLCLPVDMDVWYGGIVACGTYLRLLQVKTVADTDKLAQASYSRLGEINRGSPKPFSPRMVAQASCCGFWASRQLAQARGISPKRDPALPTL